MTVAFPWSGRDVNALVPLSGRAAVPNTPAGTGFNWPSLVGRVSGYIRPVRGWGMSGLGQDSTDIYGAPTTVMDGSSTDNLSTALTDFASLNPSAGAPMGGGSMASLFTNLAANGASSASTQAPWWGSILASSLTSGLKVGSQIASYQLNPLYQKSTFYQTPQGAIYASNAPSGGIPGLTTTGSSLLPILLIGGGLLMVMMMSRR